MLACTVVLTLTVAARVAAGQDVVHDFGSLATRVQAGDELIVKNTTGQSLRGRLLTLSPTNLKLVVSGAERTIEAAHIAAVTRAYRDPRWTGALIGLAVGTALGAGLGRSLMREYKQDIGPGDAAIIALEIGAVGAGAGFVIDALVPGRQVVYRGARVALVVPVGSGGARVLVAARF